METIIQDIRFGARALRKNPMFALIAMFSLALGIGGNSAIFSVVHAVLLRPLPFPESQRLYKVWCHFPAVELNRLNLSEAELIDVQRHNQVLEHLAGYDFPVSFNLNPGEPERLEGARVSADFFPLFGIRPQLGRTFLAGEDRPGHDVVVLSDSLFRQAFGGDRGILGRPVMLSGRPYVVIGVMPPGFDFPENAKLWAPLAIDPGALEAGRGRHYLDVVGRLRPGVSPQQARLGMAEPVRYLVESHPGEYPPKSGYSIAMVPLTDEIIGEIRPTLLLLTVTVGIVLLIACANLANLLLLRAQAREKELAVRTALGARRSRLLRQALTESVLLALLGGGAGLALSYWGTHLLIAINAKDIPRSSEIALDGTVVLFTLIGSLLSGLLFGLVPALYTYRRNLAGSLADGLGRSSASAGGTRVRSALVMLEIAMALILLIGAGLVMKSFFHLQRVEPGFRRDSLLTMKLTLPSARYPSPDQMTGFYERLTEKLKELPGVQTVGAISNLPLSGSDASGNFGVEGRLDPPGVPLPEAGMRSVTADYFQAMGTSLLQGRYFSSEDQPRTDNGGVVIVDQALANLFWPGQNPIGKGLRPGGMRDQPWRRIVGVVATVHHKSLDTDPHGQIYFPLTQRPARSMYIALRCRSNPKILIPAVRRAVFALDSEQPVYDLATMDQRLSDSLAKQRLAAVLLGVFAGVALVLAVIGIYGVMAYTVSQRTRELGIRMALGAQQGTVLSMVVRQGLKLTLVGLALGLCGAFGLSRLLSSLLYHVGTADLLTYLTISLGLIVVGIVACSIPARRAARVDPNVALRHD